MFTKCRRFLDKVKIFLNGAEHSYQSRYLRYHVKATCSGFNISLVSNVPLGNEYENSGIVN